jgi:hypothetical protein
MAEGSNTIHAWKRALSAFQPYPTEKNLISFKLLYAKAQCIICEAKHNSWEACQMSHRTKLQQMSGKCNRTSTPGIPVGGAIITFQTDITIPFI